MALVVLPDTVSRNLESARPSQAPEDIPERNQIISYVRVSNQPSTAYSNIRLNLDIDHTAIGDLVVRLRSPQGRTFLVHNRTGGTTDNLDLIGFALPSSRMTNPNGIWKLQILDIKAGNVGKLVDWKLSFSTKTTAERVRDRYRRFQREQQ
jgi:subtilisin-like proprotein convertase family protein